MRKILTVAALCLTTMGVPLAAQAQSTGSSSSGGASSGSVGSGSSPSPGTMAPSGGRPTGLSASGPQTPVQAQEQQKMKKDTQICKGC